ncbi:hypothetical protein KP803_08635 [Vibrio sp. ZSDE26]|uniref:LafD n=1 Tax=Vibrio amylolyticus TaxID=2847292 RepID=A0A9X2BGV7_9VIBR|nr:hypothetical protein [Vibrio amylolyticus]MCK6263344.1 hypothetical protein [Vibrio amylolyticus]
MEINSALLRSVNQKLQSICKNKEWKELRSLDLKIRQILTVINEQPRAAQRLKHDLIALKESHSQAIALCDEEKQRIGRVLASLHNQREGASEYSQVERASA